MKYENIFHLLSEILKETGVSSLVIGGFAVNHYHFSRTTGDIDLLMTEGNFEQIWPRLEKTGCKQVFRNKLFVTLQSEVPPPMAIDIGFVDSETFLKMVKEQEKTEIAGYPFTVLSLNHLIAMKLHAIKNNPEGRERWDLRDILELIKANRVDIKDPHFRDSCVKYGSEEIYKKILQGSGKWKS